MIYFALLQSGEFIGRTPDSIPSPPLTGMDIIEKSFSVANLKSLIPMELAYTSTGEKKTRLKNEKSFSVANLKSSIPMKLPFTSKDGKGEKNT